MPNLARILMRGLLVVCFIAAFSAIARAEVLQEIVVKEGDTLWSVATYYLKDPRRWPEILKHNELSTSDPNVILPGMKLRVPILLIKENLRAAILFHVVNDVRYRRSKSPEWNSAFLDMKLYNDDGLRTLQQSIAQVKFPSGEVLKLDENSLIILRPDKAREEVNLLSGGVRSSKTKVLTKTTDVDPRIEPRGPAPDFKTKIKEDKTTLVEVYEGVVDVTAQGRTVTLTKGFGTEVKYREAPSLPHTLPPQPTVDLDLQSADNTPQAKGTVAAPVTVASQSIELNIKAPGPTTNNTSSLQQKKEETKPGAATKAVTKYHLQVSTSSTFNSFVIDLLDAIDDKINIDFAKHQLDDGVYYYRIAYLDELGFEGKFTSPVKFIIDTLPPHIEIYPIDEQKGKNDKFVHVEGKTEPGAIVRIDDKFIPVDEKGTFLTAILAKRFNETITVVAEDRAGNIAREQIMVTGHKILHMKEETVVQKKVKKKGSFFASASIAVITAAVIVGVLVLIVQ